MQVYYHRLLLVKHGLSPWKLAFRLTLNLIRIVLQHNHPDILCLSLLGFPIETEPIGLTHLPTQIF